MNRLTPAIRTGFTHLDLLVLLMLVPVVVVFIAACSRHPGESADRVRCSSNLRQIGQALFLYSSQNKGAYPRTICVPGASVSPVFGTGVNATDPFGPSGPQPNDVTAGLFLLLRTTQIGSEVFICPKSKLQRDTFGGRGTALRQSNFSDYKKNLSYSIANPYPNDPAATAEPPYRLNTANLGPEFAVAADINPGIKGKNDNVTGLTTSDDFSKMRFGNSNSHEKVGQNVLYGDGHVAYQSNPLCGVQRDNIYTNKTGQIIASPVDGNDSLLLPTDD